MQRIWTPTPTIRQGTEALWLAFGEIAFQLCLTNREGLNILLSLLASTIKAIEKGGTPESRTQFRDAMAEELRVFADEIALGTFTLDVLSPPSTAVH